MTPAKVIAMPAQRRQWMTSPSITIESTVANGTVSCTTTATTEAAVSETPVNIQRPVEEGDLQDVGHASCRRLQEGNEYDREDREPQPGEEQRRQLVDADLGGDEIEAPDRADQDHQQKMLQSHRTDIPIAIARWLEKSLSAGTALEATSRENGEVSGGD
jgi:hypothetical protein